MDEKKIRTLAVAGPTASGKSALAVYLAKELGGEVISCDSMQIYRGMDIGTGKVTEEEKEGVRHRMLDLFPPEHEFSLSEYLALARGEIGKAAEARCVPILCGGTGLYLDRLLDGAVLSEARGDPALRERLEKLDSDELYDKLMTVDPESAAATHKNNRKRVIRALEIYLSTGVTKSAWDRASVPEDRPYDALRILLLPSDRAALYAAIDARVDRMFENGLEEEARRLFSSPCSSSAAQAIGYKEFLPYFEGKTDLSSVRERVKQASRNYAKRQITWFGNGERMKGKRVLLLDPYADEHYLTAALEAAKDFLFDR